MNSTNFRAWILIFLWQMFYGNVIRVAHLQPKNPNNMHETYVLKQCATDLKEQRILPDGITFQIFTMESCNKFCGVEHAAYLHYIKNVSVYFGPGCNNEMLIIGRLLSRWNVPIIAHLSGNDALSDRTIFDTLGSVALSSAIEMARATLTYIKLCGWKQVGLVRSNVNYKQLSIHSLESLLKHDEVEINIIIEFDPFQTPDEIILSGKLDKLRNNARIIIVEFGLDMKTSHSFLTAALRSNMKTNEFVYIIPWLAHLHDHYYWETDTEDEAELAFDGVIVITPHGYDRQFLDSFNQRFPQLTSKINSHYATLSYMSLYDALYLYGLAVRDAYDDTRDVNIHLNGSAVWQKLTSRQFIGSTGQVLMNNKGLRVPSYGTYYLKNKTMTIVVELTAKLDGEKKCDHLQYDCSEHVPTEILSNYWSSYDGSMPTDVPKCGFDGSLCDYTTLFIIGGVLLFTAIVTPLGYFIYLKQRERMLYDMTWRISREQVRLLKKDCSKLESFLGKSAVSGSFAGSLSSKADSRISAKQAICSGVRVAYKRFQQTRNLTFSKADLMKLERLKFIENNNLNNFYGICFNQQNELLVLWVLCQRGSLEDVIFNEELKLNRNFQASFAKDVVKGLYFIHTSNLKYHGFVCLQNCLVDSNWTVKHTNFVTEELISEKLQHNELKYIIDVPPNRTELEQNSETKDNSPGTKDLSNRKYIQQAPEIIKELIKTKFLPPGSQAADVYGLGMVLYQILFRVQPFFERDVSNLEIMEMVACARDNGQIIRPTFPSQQTGEEPYSLQLLSAIEDCWRELPEMRPSVKKSKKVINSNLNMSGNGSLIDQMLKMLEDYTTNLEAIVKDRTALLEEAQMQADRLLKNMLPTSIVEDLKVGKPVVPQLYQAATVLFSDIRGFTQISSTSTPFQIVTFLNDMFSGFDAIIAKHDAYKVETIGDAYMIVSGVPHENGNTHVQHIADIALKMRTFVSNFKLEHKPEEIMMVRIGFHTGSVAAGVVGLAAPRYCLFGNTVNMASRMESTGVANKIQVSEKAFNLLHCFYPQFTIVERGTIEVKGIGQCKTYFLEGKEMKKDRNEFN